MVNRWLNALPNSTQLELIVGPTNCRLTLLEMRRERTPNLNISARRTPVAKEWDWRSCGEEEPTISIGSAWPYRNWSK